MLSYRELPRDVPIPNDSADQVFQQLVEDATAFQLEPRPETASEPVVDPPQESPSTPGGADTGPDLGVADAGPPVALTDQGPAQGGHEEQQEVAYVLEPDGTLTLVSGGQRPDESPDGPTAALQAGADSTSQSMEAPPANAAQMTAAESPIAPGRSPDHAALEARVPGETGSASVASPSEAPADPPEVAEEPSIPVDSGQVLFDLGHKPPQSEQKPVGDGTLPTACSVSELAQRLERLHRGQRRHLEEAGVNRLHLAFGFLRWRDSAESTVPHLAPLVLVPVHLVREPHEGNDAYRVVYRGEGVDINHALSEKLRRDLAITLPGLSEGQSPESFWKDVEASVIDHASEGWSVVPDLVLAEFPVEGQAFWYDLEPSHWPTQSPLLDRAVVRRVLLGPGNGGTPPEELTRHYDLDTLKGDQTLPTLTLVRDADPFQHAVLVDGLGKTEGLVVEGAPGCGKSQTITNLIASAMGGGKSVLFVAQKRAALEVVQRRLGEAGLGPFCLDFSGSNTGNEALLESLRERLAHTVAPPAGFDQRLQELNAARQELVAVSTALSEPTGPEGLPLHDVVWHVEQLRRELPDDFTPVSAPDAGQLDKAAYQRLRDGIDELGKAWSAVPKQAVKAWQGFVPGGYRASHRGAVEESLKQGLAAIDKTNAWLSTEEVAPVASQLRDTRCLVQLGGLDPATALSPLPTGAAAAVVHKLVHAGLFAEFKELLQRLTEYQNAVKGVDRLFDFNSEQAETHAKILHDKAKLLAGKLCSESVLLADLPKEVEQLKGIIDYVDSLPKLAEPVIRLLGRPAETLEVYALVADEGEKLASGPGELWLHANPGHAKPIAAERLTAALDERDNLSRFAEAALGMFALERTPDPDALKWAYRTVQQGKNLFGPKSTEYKRAVDLIRSTLKKGGDFSNKPKFLKALESFIQYCEWCQEFEHSEFYRESFGFLFKGMDSNWGAMERLVQFSQGLRKKLGDGEAERILSDWEGHTRAMGRARGALLEAVNKTRQYKVGRDLPEDIWRQPVVQLADSLRQWLSQVEGAIEAVRQPWCNGRVTLAEALEAVTGYQRAKKFEQIVRSHAAFGPLLAQHWKGAATKPETLEAGMSWVDACLKQEGMDLNLLRWLMPTEQGVSRQRLDALLDRVTEFRTVLNRQYGQLKQLGDLKLRYWLGTEDPSLEGFKGKLSACLETLESLPSMARLRSLHGELGSHGYGALVQLVTSGRLAGQQCGLSLEYSVYAALLKQKMSANPLLASFAAESYEKLRERFAALDGELLAASGQFLAARLRKLPVPAGVDHGPVNAFSEKGLLEHEMAKTSHRSPVRQLFSRAPQALRALKPCFLMSSFAVSQYLPADQTPFDLVILDEASQLLPEAVLGAMARGRKVVVFGDSKQLQPIALANSASTGGQAPRSILDVCLQSFPRRCLRRHYRSLNPALIRFCNEHFYANELSVPAIPRGSSWQTAIKATVVENGRCVNGRNQNEAAVVIANVIHHFRHRPHQSLGVVTFGERQAELIHKLLDKRRAQSEDVDQLFLGSRAAEPLFVKDVGQVQGDERDVIFLSTTLGPDEAEGAQPDWRALNVAATRGRQRIEIFSSIRPPQGDAQPGAESGAPSLSDYVRYVTSGQLQSAPAVAQRSPRSAVEQTLVEVIEESGFKVSAGVGPAGLAVDLGVASADRPDHYLLGVMFDGPGYHAAQSIRDRDRQRPSLLQDRGWVLHRVWSASWYRTYDAEVERLRQALAGCGQQEAAFAGGASDNAEDAEAPAAADCAGEPAIVEQGPELAAALERFWEKNIQPHLPDRATSILSTRIMERIAAALPRTAAEWESAVPAEFRSDLDARQLVFLDDILAVVADHA